MLTTLTSFMTPMLGETGALLVGYGILALIAVLALWIGFKICTMVGKMAGKALARAGVDISLRGFVQSLVTMALKALVVITIAGMVGIEVTSFIALLGAAGLAIGMSLQGALGNFAGGVLILLFKPFKVGDLIEGEGHLGVVKEIKVVSTVLTTLDNRNVVIPNGPLANGSIVNYSTEELRRVDLTFGIGYGDDIKKARTVILDIAKNNAKVLQDPQPFVGVMTLNDSSVDLECRVWCKNADYWDVYFAMNESVKNAFDAMEITIPYPHSEVFMHNVA